jgi:hypothetical protein
VRGSENDDNKLGVREVGVGWVGGGGQVKEGRTGAGYRLPLTNAHKIEMRRFEALGFQHSKSLL